MSNENSQNEDIRHTRMWRFFFFKHPKTNQERIDVVKGAIDDIPVEKIAQSIESYEKRHLLLQFFQRLFTRIKEKIILYKLYKTLLGEKNMQNPPQPESQASPSNNLVPAVKAAKKVSLQRNNLQPANQASESSKGVVQTIVSIVPKSWREKCNFWPFNQQPAAPFPSPINLQKQDDAPLVLTKNEQTAWAILLQMYKQHLPSKPLSSILPEKVTYKQVRQAFRDLSLLFHPDKQSDDKARIHGGIQFIKITDNYQKLWAANQSQETRRIAQLNGTFDADRDDSASNSANDESSELEALKRKADHLYKEIESIHQVRDQFGNHEKLAQIYTDLGAIYKEFQNFYRSYGWMEKGIEEEYRQISKFYYDLADGMREAHNVRKAQAELTEQIINASEDQKELTQRLDKAEQMITTLKRLAAPISSDLPEPVLDLSLLAQENRAAGPTSQHEINRYRLFPSEERPKADRHHLLLLPTIPEPTESDHVASANAVTSRS